MVKDAHPSAGSSGLFILADVVKFQAQGRRKQMVDQKRRTEIRIETHEITIIRFGKTHAISSPDRLLEEADVTAYDDADPRETGIKEEEKRNEDQN